MLRAVLFDLDETLIPEDVPLRAGFAAVAREIWGAGADEGAADELRRLVRDRWERDAPHPDFRARLGIGSSDGLSDAFEGPGPELAELRAFAAAFRRSVFAPLLPEERRSEAPALAARWRAARFAVQHAYPGAVELLRALGQLRLALVTNGPSALQREKLAWVGLAGCFDAVVVSMDVGVGKPAPEIFAAALAAVDCRPEEAVMVGNDQRRDIEGARAAGLGAIRIDHGRAPEEVGPGVVTSLAAVPGALGRS